MSIVSLVVTTFNRKYLLMEALESVMASRGLVPSYAEVIIVDNNSTDGTGDAVTNLRQRLPTDAPIDLRYVVEPNQGLSFARNRGIAEARGEFIAFMDDDQIIDPLYLTNIERAFATTGAACVGGDIYFYNIDHKQVPRAVSMKLAAAERFFGPAPRQLRNGIDYFTGGNMAIKKRIIEEAGPFSENLGLIGNYQWGGEEYELQDRIHAIGGTLWSHPQLTMKHYCPPERMQLAYYRERALKEGRSIYLGNRDTWIDGRRMLDAPAFLWPALMRDIVRYGTSLFTFDRAIIFQREYILRSRLGTILEARKCRRDCRGATAAVGPTPSN